jgi:hemoglobin
LLIDFLCASAGGLLLYVGRDMKISHKAGASTKATCRFFGAISKATLDAFNVPAADFSASPGFFARRRPHLFRVIRW